MIVNAKGISNSISYTKTTRKSGIAKAHPELEHKVEAVQVPPYQMVGSYPNVSHLLIQALKI